MQDTPDGVAERWFWLTYDLDRGRRLGVLSAFDAPARALDRVVAGEDPGEGWMTGPAREAPSADEESAGRVIRARVLEDVRRVLAGHPPRDLVEALLMWLVKYGDVASPRLRRALFPSLLDRPRGGAQLRRLRPDLDAFASPRTVALLVAMLLEVRPPAAVGYIGAPTGP